MNLSSKTIEILLFVFNLVFALCGLAVLICGVVEEIEWRHLMPYYSLHTIGIIVTGGITFVIALFGCFNAIRKYRRMFITFGIFISIVLVVQIALSIYLSVARNRIQKTDVEFVYERWFYRFYVDFDSRIRVYSVQNEKNCCGIDGPDDFLKILNATGTYPWSCCEDRYNDGSNDGCESKNVYRTGCRKYVYDMFMPKEKLLSGIIYGISAVELIGIIFAFLFARAIRNIKRLESD